MVDQGQAVIELVEKIGCKHLIEVNNLCNEVFIS